MKLKLNSMNFTIEQLECILSEQKKIVVDRLLNCLSSYSNSDINKEEFTKIAMSARMPQDIEVLKKYYAK
jgi:hypothetical protein